MTTEKQQVDFVQIAFIVFGVAVATAIARIGFGFDGIIPGAIAGAIGGLVGTVVHALVRGVSRQKS